MILNERVASTEEIRDYRAEVNRQARERYHARAERAARSRSPRRDRSRSRHGSREDRPSVRRVEARRRSSTPRVQASTQKEVSSSTSAPCVKRSSTSTDTEVAIAKFQAVSDDSSSTRSGAGTHSRAKVGSQAAVKDLGEKRESSSTAGRRQPSPRRRSSVRGTSTGRRPTSSCPAAAGSAAQLLASWSDPKETSASTVVTKAAQKKYPAGLLEKESRDMTQDISVKADDTGRTSPILPLQPSFDQPIRGPSTSPQDSERSLLLGFSDLVSPEMIVDAEMIMNLAPAGTEDRKLKGVVPMKPMTVRATPDSTAPSSTEEDSDTDAHTDKFNKAVAEPQKWADSKLWSAAVRVPLLT